MSATNDKPPERRVTPRYNVKLQVRVIWPDNTESTLPLRDFSNTGLFLEMAAPLPAMGLVLQVQLQNPMAEGEMPVIKARVVRHTPDGFGLLMLTE